MRLRSHASGAVGRAAWLVGATGIAALGAAAQASPPQILVYYATAGYYHESIPTAMDAIGNIGHNSSLFDPTFSKNESLFTPDQLAPYSAIVFLSNSDQVLTDSGEAALADWLTKGGSLVGLHAGTACLFNDTAFGTAMGSWFDYHPPIQNVTFTKLMNHSTVDPLPDRYTSYEEAYHFRSDPRDVNCTVLLSYDPSTVDDPKFGTRPYYEGTPPPIAWFREGQPTDLSNGTAATGGVMPGRTWMTSLGHTIEIWKDPTHLAHVEAGLRWALEPFNDAVNTTSSSSSSASYGTPPSSSSPASSSSKAGSSSGTPAGTSAGRRACAVDVTGFAAAILAAVSLI